MASVTLIGWALVLFSLLGSSYGIWVGFLYKIMILDRYRLGVSENAVFALIVTDSPSDIIAEVEGGMIPWLMKK